MLKAEEIIDRIAARFHDASFEIKQGENIVQFNFSVEWQKEYTYSAGISVNRHKLYASIGATLINEESKEFWYKPFDAYYAKTKEEEWEDSLDFLESGIALLLIHPTKIIQRKLWIWNSYCLYYLKDDEWIRYYFAGGWRWFDPPVIEGKKREWR